MPNTGLFPLRFVPAERNMATPAAIPTRPLARFVDGHSAFDASIEELPLVHSTRCERFREIAISNTLSPIPCPVFKEPLVYLFYGRPAYRSHRGGRASTDIAFCPICFVFKPHTIADNVTRIFPFDSGAWQTGRFKKHIASDNVDHYELTTAIDSARRVTHLFFETNNKYFLGEAKKGISIPASEIEASSYYRLISEEGEADYDDRRSAIELQARDNITLRDTLLSVILPCSFLQDPAVRSVIVKTWRTYPLSYSTVKGTMPGEYNSVIRAMLQEHLRRGGYL